MQVSCLLIEDDQLPPNELDELAMMIQKARCLTLVLDDCKLSDLKLKKFNEKCRTENIQVI